MHPTCRDCPRSPGSTMMARWRANGLVSRSPNWSSAIRPVLASHWAGA